MGCDAPPWMRCRRALSIDIRGPWRRRYAFVELASGNRHTGHNGLQDWLLVYIIPNYCWIVFPYIIVLSLGRRLMVAAASSKPKSS